MIIAQSGAASIPAPTPGILPLVLRYDSDDPYAVVLEFPRPSVEEPDGGGPDADAAPVSWRVSRDLLFEGLHAPAGEGDIRLVPREGLRTEVGFRNRNGAAVVQVDTAELTAFLDATADAVRRGDEHRHLLLPGTLEDFLRMTDA